MITKYHRKEINQNMSKVVRLLLPTLALAMFATAAVSAPRLTIPESAFNFGYVPQNSKVSHQFWLLSTGDDSLRILKIVPG